MVILDVAGVGYEVHIPVTTAEKIPAAGNECRRPDAPFFEHIVPELELKSLNPRVSSVCCGMPAIPGMCTATTALLDSVALIC